MTTSPCTSRNKLIPFLLAATVALATVACDGGERDGRTTPEEAARAETDPTVSPDASSGTRFLDPLTDGQPVRNLFEVEADHAEYWRMFTLDRYDGVSWTSTDPDGSEGGIFPSAPATTLPRGVAVGRSGPRC
jgi:hypothetical protein